MVSGLGSSSSAMPKEAETAKKISMQVLLKQLV